MNDSKLIDLLRRSSPQAPLRTASCPDESEIASYVDAAIHQAAREKLELHLADCERCARLVAALARVRDEPADVVSAETLHKATRLVPTRLNRWNQYLPRLAAAAVLVLAVSVLIDIRQDQPVQIEPDYRTTRGPGAPEVQIISPTSGAGVNADDLLVSWTEFAGARYYLVRIVTSSGELVTEQRVTRTEWRPRNDVSLESGKEYYVRVEAYPAVGPSTGSVHVPFTVHSTH